MFLKCPCIHLIISFFCMCRFEVSGEVRVLKCWWYRPGLVLNTFMFINCWVILSRSDSNCGELCPVDLFTTLASSSNTEHTEFSSPQIFPVRNIDSLCKLEKWYPRAPFTVLFKCSMWRSAATFPLSFPVEFTNWDHLSYSLKWGGSKTHAWVRYVMASMA